MSPLSLLPHSVGTEAAADAFDARVDAVHFALEALAVLEVAGGANGGDGPGEGRCRRERWRGRVGIMYRVCRAEAPGKHRGGPNASSALGSCERREVLGPTLSINVRR
jgi:hypothetical protein